MSPKFYGLSWLILAVSAGIIWLSNVFTMLAVVVFGSIAFGLVFAGMMCVLPGVVSHTTDKETESPAQRKTSKPAKPESAKAAHGFGAYRSA